MSLGISYEKGNFLAIQEIFSYAKMTVMNSQSEMLINERMALRTFPVKLLEVFKTSGGDISSPFLLLVRMVAEKERSEVYDKKKINK
jgi:hypothetical protein